MSVKRGDVFEVIHAATIKGDTSDWLIGDRLEAVEPDGNLGYWVMLNRRTQNLYSGLAPDFRADAMKWWRRCARQAPSIEEQRKALKAGDVIKDPALLCKGMRVCIMSGKTKTGLQHARAADFELGDLDEEGFWRHASGQLLIDPNWVAADGARFLGWADEAKPKPTPPPRALPQTVHLQRADGGLLCCGFGCPQGDAISTNANQFNCKACLEAWAPRPAPRALPFKRHPMCSVAHAAIVGERNCLGCERLIAVDTQLRDDSIATRWPPKRPSRPEPHTLAPSGMCGPILARVR